MRTSQEYTNVLWEEIKKMNLVESKKGEGVLLITMDVPDDADITQLVAAKHVKNIVAGVPNEGLDPLTSDNVYRILSMIAHQIMNYVIDTGGYTFSLDNKLAKILKNNVVHLMVAGVLLEDGIII